MYQPRIYIVGLLTAAKTTSKLYSIYTFSMAASLSINEGSKESNQGGDEYVLRVY